MGAEMNQLLQDLINQRNEKSQERQKISDAYKKVDDEFKSLDRQLACELSPFKIGDHVQDSRGDRWKITEVTFLLGFETKENIFAYRGQYVNKNGELGKKFQNILYEPFTLIESGEK